MRMGCLTQQGEQGEVAARHHSPRPASSHSFGPSQGPSRPSCVNTAELRVGAAEALGISVFPTDPIGGNHPCCWGKTPNRCCFF